MSPATLQILLALVDGERHGYAIMREVRERTQGTVRLGPGTLYTTLKRLLAAGWIVESGERPAPDADDERRRYYRLMPPGRQAAAVEVERLRATVRTADEKNLLGPNALPEGA